MVQVRVNDDPCSSGADQRDPWISVAPNGRVDVVFYDRRNDPEGLMTNDYYSSSSDGWQAFSPNKRINDRSFSTKAMFIPKSAGFQSREFHAHIGIASSNAGAIAAWADSRNAPADDPKSPLSDVVIAFMGAESGKPTKK